MDIGKLGLSDVIQVARNNPDEVLQRWAIDELFLRLKNSYTENGRLIEINKKLTAKLSESGKSRR